MESMLTLDVSGFKQTIPLLIIVSVRLCRHDQRHECDP